MSALPHQAGSSQAESTDSHAVSTSPQTIQAVSNSQANITNSQGDSTDSHAIGASQASQAVNSHVASANSHGDSTVPPGR